MHFLHFILLLSAFVPQANAGIMDIINSIYYWWWPTTTTTTTTVFPHWAGKMCHLIPNYMDHIKHWLLRVLPRFTLFQFQPAPKKFAITGKYWEGPAHYGLFTFLCMLGCFLLLFIYFCFIRCIGMRYPFYTMPVYRLVVFLIGLIVMLLTLVSAVGQAFYMMCLFAINDNAFNLARARMTNFALEIRDTLASVYGYVDFLARTLHFVSVAKEGRIPNTVYKSDNFDMTPDSVTTTTHATTVVTTFSIANALLESAEIHAFDKTKVIDKKWTSVAHDVRSRIYAITRTLKEMSAVMTQYMMKTIYIPMINVKGPAERTLKVVLNALQLAKTVKFYLILHIVIGVIVHIMTLMITICMVTSACGKKNERMKWVCRICFPLMILWWMIAVAYIPIIFYIQDMCEKPVESFATMTLVVANYYGKNTSNFTIKAVEHFSACKGPNPYTWQYADMLNNLGLIGKGLTMVLNGISSYGVAARKLVMIETGNTNLMILLELQVYIYRHILEGCEYGANLFEFGRFVMCGECVLGLAVTGIVAPFIGVFLTLFMMVGTRIKHFVGGKPKPESLLEEFERIEHNRISNFVRNQKKLREKRASRLKKKLAKIHHEVVEGYADRIQQNREDDLRKQFRQIRKFHNRKFKIIKMRNKRKHEELAKRLLGLSVCKCPPPPTIDPNAPLDVDVKCPDECGYIKMSDVLRIKRDQLLKPIQQRKKDKLKPLKPPAPECPKECGGHQRIGLTQFTCKGLNRIKELGKLGVALPDHLTKIREPPEEVLKPMDTCPEVECPYSGEALEKLEFQDRMIGKEPDNKFLRTVRLSCGCKYATKALRHIWKYDVEQPK